LSLRAGLEVWGKRPPLPRPGFDSQGVQPLANRYTDWVPTKTLIYCEVGDRANCSLP